MAYPLPKSVAEAATHMDDFCPGWYNKIDISALNMIDAQKCIIGQLFNQQGSLFGKILYNMYGKYNTSGYYSGYDTEWLDEINKRKQKKSMTYLEAYAKLLQGEKIRCKNWSPNVYWVRKDCFIHWDDIVNDGGVLNGHIHFTKRTDWEVYTPVLTFGQLKAGEKFTYSKQTTVYTKLADPNKAINTKFESVFMGNDVPVERVDK